MRYSFSFVPDSCQLDGFESLIRGVESDGFHVAWTPDQGYMVDPFVALTLAARQSSRLQLGLGVTSPFMRHPLQIARASASLANLSGGRFILGLGAGEKARIRDPIGAPVAPFVGILDDTFDALRGLLGGESVNLANDAFVLRDVALEIACVHKVPIYLATTAPSAFRLAGARADGVIVGDVSDPDVMARIVGWVNEGAISAGRSLADIDIVAWCATVVTDDREPLWEQLRRRVVGTALSSMSKPTRRLLGVNESDIPAILSARRDDAVPLSESAIPDALVERVAIVGDVDAVAARIKALEAVGVTTMGFRMPVALQDKISFADNIARLTEGVLQG
jgi:5,10-methylenetetrahydromethanopterin reductase